MPNQLHIAIVGLRFGASFPSVYAAHPDISKVTICDTNAQTLTTFGDKYNLHHRTTNLHDILTDNSIHAVHLITPIPSHADLTLKVLNAGKHCACTVPMATSLDDLAAIIHTQQKTGLNYMMMETAAYTYHCLAAQQMLLTGDFGQLQFLRGAHYQDMENWPDYWMGLPPMHYATHAIAPLLKLANRRATKVHCLGSGTMRPELQTQYQNPFPIETALFQLDGPSLAAEVTRSLFHTARPYAEIFTLYGEKASFEWTYEHDLPAIHRMAPLQENRGRPITTERFTPPTFRHLLPEPLQKFDNHTIIPDPQNPHQSILQGGAHHGSHPHLVHEFIRSIIEQRKPAIDAHTAANWSAAGICAHLSALKNATETQIPTFT